MNKQVRWLSGLVLACALVACSNPVVEKSEPTGNAQDARSIAAPVGIEIDKNQTRQSIWGFGIAANDPVYDLQTGFSASAQTAVLDKLFRTDSNNAGLSIIRLEINPFAPGSTETEWAKVETTHEVTQGTINWNVDGHQRWFSSQAISRYPGMQFLVEPWSPPAWAKSNRSVVNGGGIDPAKMSAYVKYLYDWVKHYKDVYGYNIKWMSVQNEPDISTAYASAVISSQQMSELIIAVKDYFTANGLSSVMIGAPEHSTRTKAVAMLNAFSTAAKGKMDFIAVHDYGGASNLSSFGKPVLNTEWNVRDGANTAMDMSGATAMLALMHKALNYGEKGWLYWWAVRRSTGETPSSALVHLQADGSYQVSKRLYAMGQFSRFIRPGDQMIASAVDTTNLMVSAAKDASGRAAIVVSNTSAGAISKSVKGLSGNSVLVYRTSNSESLKQLSTVAVQSGSFSYSFPANSVTTFVEQSTVVASPTPTPSVTPAPSNAPGSKVVSASADSYTRDGTYTAINYGTSTSLFVKGSATTGNERKAYFKFSLAGVASVQSAKLRVYGKADAAFSVLCSSHTDDSWTEAAITYTNNPKSGAAIVSTAIGTTAQYYEWDVTAFVKTQFAGDKTVTLYLADPTVAEKLFTANSREMTTNPVQLVVMQ